jgi:hypothetical protein
VVYGVALKGVEPSTMLVYGGTIEASAKPTSNTNTNTMVQGFVKNATAFTFIY